MSIKNDRWSALSMQQRADLIRLYISNGITSLDSIKKDYNSFGPGGDIQHYKEKSLPGNWLQRLAYKFGSDPEVSSKGIASMEDILRILKSSEDINWEALDNNKATYLFGNILGLFPAGETKGKDYSNYLKKNYPLKHILGKIKEYEGTINPFNEYVIDSRDRGLVEELAKKGKGLYSNSDIEYSYMFDTYDTLPYKEDVANYHMQFVNTPNGISVSASDLYDFGKDYNPEDYDDSDNNNHNNLLTDIEVAAFTAVGNPFVYRQENIPIRFIDTKNNMDEEGTRASELSRAWDWSNLSNEDLEKGISFDEKIAGILDTGYIEPAIVTAESKKANGGKLNSFGDGGDKRTKIESNPSVENFIKDWYFNPTTLQIMTSIENDMYNQGIDIKSSDIEKKLNVRKALNTPEYITSLEDDKQGHHVYNSDGTSYIEYNDAYLWGSDNPFPFVRIHEIDHDIQKRMPAQTLLTTQPVEYKLNEGFKEDSYLDRPDEIRSRIMELRKFFKLNPSKRDYTPKEAAKFQEILQENELNVASGIERLSPETLAGFLNYLAYNDSNKNQEVKIAKYGGRILDGNEEEQTTTGLPVGAGLATYNHPKYNHAEEAEMYSYLRGRGVPHIQASAIMGNIAVESMLNPEITQIGGGGGYGLIQATDKTRKNTFINYDGQPYEFGSNISPETQRQLDYIIDKGLNSQTKGEWRGNHNIGRASVAKRRFLEATDINKASTIFTENYLRPGKPHTKRRKSMSNYFNDNYGITERALEEFENSFLFQNN